MLVFWGYFSNSVDLLNNHRMHGVRATALLTIFFAHSQHQILLHDLTHVKLFYREWKKMLWE